MREITRWSHVVMHSVVESRNGKMVSRVYNGDISYTGCEAKGKTGVIDEASGQVKRQSFEVEDVEEVRVLQVKPPKEQKKKHKWRKRFASFVSLGVGIAMNCLLPGSSGLLMTVAKGMASHFAGSLVENKGKIDKTLKKLTSKESLRSLAACALTAGMGSAEALDLSSVDVFVQQLQDRMIQSVAQSTVSAVVEKKKFKDALFDGLKSAVVSTVASFGANQIGDMGSTPLKYAAHAAFGAGVGGLMNGKEGAFSGAAGAFAGELAAEALPWSPEASVAVGKMIGAGTGLLTGDVNTAFFTSDNAVTHNMLAHVQSHETNPELMDDGGQQDFIPLISDSVDPGWIVNNMTSEEFVDYCITEKYRTNPPVLSDLHLEQQRFTNFYEGFRQTDLQKRLTYGPEYWRHQHLSSLSEEQLITTRMQELDPQGKFTPQQRQRAVQVIKNEHYHYGTQNFGGVVAGAAGVVAMGRAGRQMPMRSVVGETAVETNLVADKMSRVKPINGQMPKNHAYANSVFPLEKLPLDLRSKYPHSVPFTGTGHPDFSRYAIKKVQIEMVGDHNIDFANADKAAGIAKRPIDYTWHHHQDGTTMFLVPKDIHKAVKHTGGVATTKERNK